MRLIDADAFKDYIQGGYEDHKSEIREEYSELAGEITKGFLKDIDEQPTISTAAITGKTEAGCKKVTIFRPHVEIRIYVNDEMLEDYKACNMLTPEQIMEDGKCAHCELNSTLYPGACMSLCDTPELRQALKEWMWYGG